LRSAFVSNARYDLSLSLVRGASHYEGKCVIRFDAAISPAATSTQASSSNQPNPFFLDFTGHSIQSLRVNGRDCTASALSGGWWRDERLTIPLACAQQGANTVEISYRNAYDHGGDGFHQFTDPVDGCEYLYTNFEPFFAVRITT
jgi:aminopeptidase N